MKINVIEMSLEDFKFSLGSYNQVPHYLKWGHWKGSVQEGTHKNCFSLFSCRDYWTEILLGLVYKSNIGATYKFAYKTRWGVTDEVTKLVMYSDNQSNKLMQGLDRAAEFLSNFHDEDITLYYDKDKRLWLLEASGWWMQSHARIGMLTGVLRVVHDCGELQKRDLFSNLYVSTTKGYRWIYPLENIDVLKAVLDYGVDTDDPLDRIFPCNKDAKAFVLNAIKNETLTENSFTGIHGSGNVRSAITYYLTHHKFPELKVVA